MVRRFQKLFDESPTFRIVLGFAAACLLLTVLGFAVGRSEYLAWFDEVVRTSVHQSAAPWMTAFMRFVTLLGSTRALTMVGIGAVVVFAVARRWRAVGLFLLTMAGQIILHHGFKELVARTRPEPLLGYHVDASYSFPSGHALASLSVYGILAWLITKRSVSVPVNIGIWTFVVVLVMLIGLSRIYFGAHNATDVIAGYLAAIIWIASVASADRVTSEPFRFRRAETLQKPNHS